jgi:CheY-like chemotaxis protein
MNSIKRIYTPVKKKTVLIVDDDRIGAHMFQTKFQSHGFSVEVACDAADAMQRLKNDPVDLVILDLCLPGMDGVEVLKDIRSQFAPEILPIVVFSNPFLTSLARAASEAGATKCVTKVESTPEEMLALVRELLVIHSSTGTSAAPPERRLQKTLVASFLTTAPETLAKLRAAHQAFARTEAEDLRQAELLEMHRQVRSLTGSANLIGFQKISQMGNALEALFIELLARPKKITPSVIRTVAQAIDTLAALFDKATNGQIDVLLPPKILVVDDEIISREMICSALGKTGLAAESLDDPLAAQRLLERNHFDLIFLDVEMPGQSGLELCVKIRETSANRTTPVVFVTSHSDFGSRAQSALSGGNDFIAKPFLLVELAVKTLTWLFKENPQPLATATAQYSAPAGADSRESQPISGRVAHSLHEESVLEPEAVP